MPQSLAWCTSSGHPVQNKDTHLASRLLMLLRWQLDCTRLTCSNTKSTSSKTYSGSSLHIYSLLGMGKGRELHWGHGREVFISEDCPSVNSAPCVGVFACKDNKGVHFELRQLPHKDTLLCTTRSVNCFRCTSVTGAADALSMTAARHREGTGFRYTASRRRFTHLWRCGHVPTTRAAPMMPATVSTLAVLRASWATCGCTTFTAAPPFMRRSDPAENTSPWIMQW